MSFNFDEIVVVSKQSSGVRSSDSERAQRDVGWEDVNDQNVLSIAKIAHAQYESLSANLSQIVDLYEYSLESEAYHADLASQIAQPSDADGKLLLDALKKAASKSQTSIKWNVNKPDFVKRNVEVNLEQAYQICKEGAQNGIAPHLSMKYVWETERAILKQVSQDAGNVAKDVRSAWRIINRVSLPALMSKGRSEEASARGSKRASENKKAKEQPSTQENSDMT